MTETPTQSDGRHTGRSRWVPLAAGVTAALLTVGAIATAGGGAAGAAPTPNAQSAGNFLDATLGGDPIDDIAKLAFARAQNPGNVTDQNPLDVTALNAINLPLTGALQLPKLLGIDLGAANQTALAKSNGESRGSAGAVLNSGGVSVGGGGEPSNATIDLCATAISGGQCTTEGADALGRVRLSVGAVASIARTPEFGPALASGWPAGCAQAEPTCYQIAGLGLQLSSPALGELLGQVNSTLTGVVSQLGTALGPISQILNGLNLNLPASCILSPGTLNNVLSLEGGAVSINVTNASLTIDLEALLAQAGLNLNNLPPNTDLLAWLLDHLTDILTTGLTGLITGLTDPLIETLDNCVPALNQLTNALGQVIGALTTAISGLKGTLDDVLGPILDALDPLTGALGSLLDIGVNVQRQVGSGDFTSNLDTTPKQGMTPPPVPYEHTVRAIEIQALGDGLTVALANSSAGPSHGPVVCCSPPPTETTVPPTDIPTGVPAGAGSTGGGSPTLPLVLLALGIMFAGAGVASYRMRGTLNRH
jgi:hypothetical protein